MKNISPTNGARPESSPILDLLESRVAAFGALCALCIKEEGRWRELSYGQLSQEARRLASVLLQTGLEAGDRVAILSEAKPEWGIAFFAAIRAGAVALPLDPKLSEAELIGILEDAEPRILLYSMSHQERAQKLEARVTAVGKSFPLDSGSASVGAHGSRGALLSARAPLEATPPATLPSRPRPLDETLLLLYTSGTTGAPKGVMITGRNLLFEVEGLKDLIRIRPEERVLSVLPLNHLLELTGGFLGILNQGGAICYAQSLYPQDLSELMREKRVCLLVGVPLLFRSLQAGIERRMRAAPRLVRLWFQASLSLAGFLPWRRLRRFMFWPLHRSFGGRLRLFISGGAPLDLQVARFFERVGIPILQGYGLTETSPVISVNTLQASKPGSVGRPLEGVEIKIQPREGDAEEGEILTRGPHVMKGYFRRDDWTREVIDSDGWFHTGDLGRIDADGFLYITGRLKNLIVLGGGKKVQPEEVEIALSRSPMIKEVCVLGRISRDGPRAGQEEVCAVVVPADFLRPRWTEAPQEVEAELADEMARLMNELAPFKRPSRVFYRQEELPKTPSRKVRRPLVADWLAEKGEDAC